MRVCLTAHPRALLELAQNQLSGFAIFMAWSGLGGSKLNSICQRGDSASGMNVRGTTPWGAPPQNLMGIRRVAGLAWNRLLMRVNNSNGNKGSTKVIVLVKGFRQVAMLKGLSNAKIQIYVLACIGKNRRWPLLKCAELEFLYGKAQCKKLM